MKMRNKRKVPIGTGMSFVGAKAYQAIVESFATPFAHLCSSLHLHLRNLVVFRPLEISSSLPSERQKMPYLEL
jgi:hypothetical protein